MMDISSPYLYRPSLVLEALLILAILRALFSPRHMTALVIGILLLRPNERFQCLVQYPKLVLVIMIFLVFTRAGVLLSWVKSKEDKYLLWFIGFVLLQTLLLQRWNLTPIVTYLATGLLLYLSVILFMSDEHGIRLAGAAVVISAFFICLEPLYYHCVEPRDSLLWRQFHWGDRLQAWGMWANANETAFLACLGMANSLSLALRSRKAVSYLITAGLGAFFTVVVVLTGSRAGLMSLLLIFAPLLFLVKSGSFRMAVGAVFVMIFLVSHSLTPERQDREASREDRFDLRYLGVELAKQHPMAGVGFMSASEVTGQPLHNTYVQAFAETGVAGGTFFLLYLIGVGRKTYKSYRERAESGGPLVVSAANAGLFLAAAFYLYWGNQLLSILFFLVMSQLKIGALWMKGEPDAACQVNASREVTS